MKLMRGGARRKRTDKENAVDEVHLERERVEYVFEPLDPRRPQKQTENIRESQLDARDRPREQLELLRVHLVRHRELVKEKHG